MGHIHFRAKRTRTQTQAPSKDCSLQEEWHWQQTNVQHSMPDDEARRIPFQKIEYEKIILTEWGDIEIVVARVDDNSLYFAVKTLCAVMQIALSRQKTKLQEDPAFAEFVGMLPMPTNKGFRDTFVINLEAIPYWITTLIRVRAELQENLTALRKKLMKAAFTLLYQDIAGSSSQPQLPSPNETERYVKFLAHRLGKVEERVFVPEAEDEPSDVVGDLEIRCANCGYRMHVQLHHTHSSHQGNSSPNFRIVQKEEG
jgi:hypothetical protein